MQIYKKRKVISTLVNLYIEFYPLLRNKTYIHKVPIDFEGKHRLQEYVKGLFPYLETGSAVKKAFQKKQIKVDRQIGETGHWVTAGSEIKYEWSYIISDKPRHSVDILFEDDELMVVRKPPGLASSGNTNSLQYHLEGVQIKESDNALPFPYLIHRLDRATEGILIAAKTMKTRRLLAEMIEAHKVRKHYVLILEGVVDRSLTSIDLDIDGKQARTEILKSEILDTRDPTSRVFVRLHTGRTHQIRRHFKAINHPLVGDNTYNKEGLTFGSGLLLCAYYLEFLHPITNIIIKVEYPIPTKICKYSCLK